MKAGQETFLDYVASAEAEGDHFAKVSDAVYHSTALMWVLFNTNSQDIWQKLDITNSERFNIE